MTSLLAIANADAGTADEEAIRDVMAALHDRRRRARHDVVARGSRRRARQHRDVDGVVVLGGDGSLHAVVDALRIGRTPRRTSSSASCRWAPATTSRRRSSLPADPVEAAKVIVAGRTRQIDLIIDGRDEVVVNAAHIGIGAEAAKAARPWKKALGPVGYVIGAVLTGATRADQPGAHLEITVDGTDSHPQGAGDPGRGRQRQLRRRRHPAPARKPIRQTASSTSRCPTPSHRGAASRTRGTCDAAITIGATTSSTSAALRSRCAATSSPAPATASSAGPRSEHSWRIEPAALTMYVP